MTLDEIKTAIHYPSPPWLGVWSESRQEFISWEKLFTKEQIDEADKKINLNADNNPNP